RPRSASSALFPYTTLFRSYYRGGHSIGEGKRTQNTCYAESIDGINWTKPSLGIVEVNGSKSNNVILAVEPETHNFSPFIDKNPRSEEHTSELQSRENLVCR